MRKFHLRWQAVVMASVVMAVSVFGSMNGDVSMAAENTDSVVRIHVPVTYEQTEARSMLEAVNAFRQGDEAWVWNEQNDQKITYSDLGALSIDPVLEQTAMLRAVEVALSFSHTRPNGESCFSAYPADIKGSIAENIAAGYSTADRVFEGWKETDRQYSGQGHRRNMLNSSYRYIGIAHVRYQGVDYWVQEFSSISSGQTLADANDTTTVEELEVLSDNIQGIQVDPSHYSMKAGESISLSDLKLYASIAGHWPTRAEGCLLEDAVQITATEEQIASVENGTLYAKSAGSTRLTVSALGQEAQIDVTVAEPEEAATSTPDITVTPSVNPSNPDATNQPGTTEKPVSTPPTNTSDPDATNQPGTTGKPVSTPPTNPVYPNITNQPSATEKPVSTPPVNISDTTTSSVGTSDTDTSKNLFQSKKVTGLKVKQKKKAGKAVVRFRKMKSAAGYRITYARNKKFTVQKKVKYTKSTSVVLSKLKHGKTYYIEVCAYYTDNEGNRRYSAESKVVKKKIK